MSKKEKEEGGWISGMTLVKIMLTLMGLLFLGLIIITIRDIVGAI